MPDGTFADVPSEGAKLEIDQALDRLSAKDETTSSESQTDTKQVQEPSQQGDNTVAEKPEPFHKHPRWVKAQDELKELRDFKQKMESQQAQNSPVVLPDWWKTQWGDTDESKERYQAVLKGELPWIKEQILNELESKQKQEVLGKKEGEEYVDTQLAEMTEEGVKFERNALLKFMVDFQSKYGSGALLDGEGNYDFRKSLQLMNELHPQEVQPDNLRKQIAAQAGRNKVSSQASSGIPVISSRALRKGNWRDADTGQFVSK